MKKAIILILLLFFSLIAVGGFGFYQLKQPNGLSQEVGFVVEKGASVRQIAADLKRENIINSPLIFRIVCRALGVDKKLRAGEYLIAPKSNVLEVADKLLRGEVFYRKITFPEGLTSAQIREILEREENLSGDITVEMPEGSILPETYTFSKGDSRNSVVAQAQKAMRKFVEKLWYEQAVDFLQDEKQLLVLASIIEKETGVPEERFDVAAVFVNRLKKGMMLQTDPTVIYAITKGEKDLGRPLLKKDLEFESPYNTYLNYGLPPAPICNPGKAAIEAAVSPSDVDYLYFVASGHGGHRFANSLSKHNENVAEYRKILKNK